MKERTVEQMESKWDVNGLTHALKTRKDWRERRAAARALLKMRDARSVEPLIEALKDDKEEVRQVAATTLGAVVILGAVETKGGHVNLEALIDQARIVRFDAPNYGVAIATIVKALKDSNEHVRWGAARALGIIRNNIAIEPLTEVLKDDDELVRREAATALEKIKYAETKLRPDTPSEQLQILVLLDLHTLKWDAE